VDARKARFSQTPAVDGQEFGRVGGELVITPKQRLRAGSTHVVTVVYGGVPGMPEDQTGALYGFVGNVPQGSTAVANGEPVGKPITFRGRTTLVWHAADRMATQNRGGNVTTEDFTALAEQVSGAELDDFRTWLRTTGRPST
jgi:hypothetical protein